MLNLRSHFTKYKLKFSAGIALLFYIIIIIYLYYDGLRNIGEKSIKSLGVDITSQITFSEVMMKDGWLSFLMSSIIIYSVFFILNSTVICLWNIYKNENHLGWKRILIFIEVAFPCYVVFFSKLFTFSSSFFLFNIFELFLYIIIGLFFGIIIATIITWIREGFKKTN